MGFELHTVKSLRSAFIIDSKQEMPDYEWRLFENGRSQPIPGSSRYATRIHTNIPKSGYCGLPTGWRFAMLNWRAAINLPLEQPALDWLHETVAHFVYNDTERADARLADLIFGSQSVDLEQAIDIQEHLSYSVRVETENKAIMPHLIAWLRSSTVADYLDQLAKMFTGHSEEILAKRRELCPARELTCWVHLEGILQQPVYR